MTGMFLARRVYLSHIARKLPLPGQIPNLTNRLRRFLDNPRVVVRRYYRPIPKLLIERFRGQRLILLMDCTALGFNYQLMVVAIAYCRRALPLVWSIHRSSRGAVSAQGQIALLRWLAPLIPLRTEVWVVRDAGFGRAALMHWLSRHHSHYCLGSAASIITEGRVSIGGQWAPLQSGRAGLSIWAGSAGLNGRISAGFSWWPTGKREKKNLSF